MSTLPTQGCNLLARYEEQVEAGESVAPEVLDELARDYPDLADRVAELRQRIRHPATQTPGELSTRSPGGQTTHELSLPLGPPLPTPLPSTQVPPNRPELALPQQRFIGKYRVIDELGEGGMGVVYLVYDPDRKCNVALKQIQRRRATPQAIEAFAKEARAAAKLDHANIVRVYHKIGRAHV